MKDGETKEKISDVHVRRNRLAPVRNPRAKDEVIRGFEAVDDTAAA